ncbi:hypothetical protein OC844_001785 [Tilletia horrida]|nr:hypothetical protein OC844_001785 [Tilletia horrida]
MSNDPSSKSTSSSSTSSYRGPLLTIVRHGETEANVAHVLQGQTDSALTVRGQAQVLALGKQWRASSSSSSGQREEEVAMRRCWCANGLPLPSAVVSSPTGRARKTACSIVLGTQRDPSKSGGGEEEASFDETNEIRPVVPTTSLSASSSTRTLPAASPKETQLLLLDPLLMEQDFGTLEGTRRRLRVPGFPLPDASMRGESREAFARRVRRVGQMWLDAAGMGEGVNRYGRAVRGKATMGSEAKEGEIGAKRKALDEQEEEEGPDLQRAMEEAGRLAEQMQSEGDNNGPDVATAQAGDDGGKQEDRRSSKKARTTNGSSAPSARENGTAPAQSAPDQVSSITAGASFDSPTQQQEYQHIVLVTHGLFISTFLNYFQPAFERPSSSFSSSTSASGSYPFASNTGSFTLGLRPVNRLKPLNGSGTTTAAAVAQELFLLRANDTAHLAGLGTLGRGSPKKEKGLQNIASFFTKKKP